jgi:formate dehydrogenase assembly factor FdhD
MIITGRCGADSINQHTKKNLRTLNAYAAKMDTAITLAQGAGIITAGEATLIRAYIAAMQAAAVAMDKLAAGVGF